MLKWIKKFKPLIESPFFYLVLSFLVWLVSTSFLLIFDFLNILLNFTKMRIIWNSCQKLTIFQKYAARDFYVSVVLLGTMWKPHEPVDTSRIGWINFGFSLMHKKWIFQVANPIIHLFSRGIKKYVTVYVCRFKYIYLKNLILKCVTKKWIFGSILKEKNTQKITLKNSEKKCSANSKNWNFRSLIVATFFLSYRASQ